MLYLLYFLFESATYVVATVCAVIVLGPALSFFTIWMMVRFDEALAEYR